MHKVMWQASASRMGRDMQAQPPQTKHGVGSSAERRLHLWRSGVFYESQKAALFRREWTSLRFGTIQTGTDGLDSFHNFSRPLPFRDDSFDAVYARRIVEHLKPAEAEFFMAELYRVCSPGAMLRLTMPDFEEMCRSYLAAVEQAWASDEESDLRRHELLLIECVDQLVRERPGGVLGTAITSGRFDSELVRERFGDVFETALSGKRWPVERRKLSFSRCLAAVRRRVLNLLFGPDPRRERETNRWMYDRLSAGLLCQGAGFVDVCRMTARDSRIAGWSRYNFDWSSEGEREMEPSLYLEARKAVGETQAC